ncbi:MAG TPA: cysteine peptidase family C39 domain-containing protein, partial [Allocoleopsis sp.]
MNKGVTTWRYSTDNLADSLEPGIHLETDSPLLKFLALAQIDELLDVKISQAIEICSFRLGDEILNFQLAPSDVNHTPIQEVSPVGQTQHLDIYFICQGRVRILCRGGKPSELDREITAQLLETGETFGADQAFCSTPVPYRAIAASPVQVGRLPGETLSKLLEQSPQLKEALFRQSRQRESLIFLRTRTALRALSSHQLLKLLPYLKEETIAAGSSLNQTVANEPGRFWLRSGIVSSQNGAVVPPEIGDSWEYPSAPATAWVAQSNVRLYVLPQSCWDTVAALLPSLDTILAESSRQQQSTVSAHTSITGVPTRSKGQVIYQTPLDQRLDQNLDQHPDQHSRSLETLPPPLPDASIQSQPIAFPKPAQRRFLDWFDRYPWVEQHSSSDCGAACLAMIAQYWGKQFPLHILRELANIGRSGASLKSLASAAERVGFHARPVRASFSRIAEQSHPWIAHWEGSHYVVVYRIKGERVIVADPAIGRRSLSQQEFQDHWTGYALLLEPTERLQETDIKQSSLTRYLGALVPYRSLIIQIILFSVLIQVFGLVTPLFTQIILD